MSLILIGSDRFAEHVTPPGHPERPERAEVMDVIAARWREGGGEVVAPRAATHEQLARVHDAGYLRLIAETAGHAVSLDADTYTSPESHEIALLAAGATDDDYRVAFEEVVVPILQLFEPEVVLVSAGFDAHERDPLGGMRLTDGAFGAMTSELRAVAAEYCDGRIVLVTEGGYDLP